MRRSGTVLDAVSAGEAANVEIHAASQCARCASGKGCGAGIFNQGIAAVQIQCQNDRLLQPGDEVVVEFEGEENSRWLAVVLGAYGLPTAGLVLSTLVAGWMIQEATPFSAMQSAAWQDLLLSIAAIAGLAGGVFAWRKLAPAMLRRADAGRCLRSGRIVAFRNESPEYAEPRRSRSHSREESR